MFRTFTITVCVTYIPRYTLNHLILLFRSTSLCDQGVLLQPANGLGGKNIVIKIEGTLNNHSYYLLQHYSFHRYSDVAMCQTHRGLNSEEVQETPGAGEDPFFFRLICMDDKRLKKIKVFRTFEFLTPIFNLYLTQFVEFRRVKYETSSEEEIFAAGEKWCSAMRARKEASLPDCLNPAACLEFRF